MAIQGASAIQQVDGRYERFIFNALISKNLSDAKPVLLFGVGVIVFV